MYRTLFYCFVFLLTFSNALADKPVAVDSIPGATLVNAEQLIDLIQNNDELLIIDVRRKEEYQRGHIENAQNILDVDLTQNQLNILAPELNQAIVFYCNGPRCLRSSNAVKKALSWEYKNIYWFRGGWKEWIDKNYPVEL